MVKVIVILGTEAVKRFRELEDQTYESLQQHGDELNELGSAEVREFETQELADAYLQGVEDANGWLDYDAILL